MAQKAPRGLLAFVPWFSIEIAIIGASAACRDRSGAGLTGRIRAERRK